MQAPPPPQQQQQQFQNNNLIIAVNEHHIGWLQEPLIVNILKSHKKILYIADTDLRAHVTGKMLHSASLSKTPFFLNVYADVTCTCQPNWIQEFAVNPQIIVTTSVHVMAWFMKNGTSSNAPTAFFDGPAPMALTDFAAIILDDCAQLQDANSPMTQIVMYVQQQQQQQQGNFFASVASVDQHQTTPNPNAQQPTIVGIMKVTDNASIEKHIVQASMPFHMIRASKVVYNSMHIGALQVKATFVKLNLYQYEIDMQLKVRALKNELQNIISQNYRFTPDMYENNVGHAISFARLQKMRGFETCLLFYKSVKTAFDLAEEIASPALVEYLEDALFNLQQRCLTGQTVNQAILSDITSVKSFVDTQLVKELCFEIQKAYEKWKSTLLSQDQVNKALPNAKTVEISKLLTATLRENQTALVIVSDRPAVKTVCLALDSPAMNYVNIEEESVTKKNTRVPTV